MTTEVIWPCTRVAGGYEVRDERGRHVIANPSKPVAVREALTLAPYHKKRILAIAPDAQVVVVDRTEEGDA